MTFDITRKNYSSSWVLEVKVDLIQ